MLLQSHEFIPRALDDPLKLRQKVCVHRVVACLEGFNCLLAAGDKDRKQGYFLSVRPRLDLTSLPRYAAAKTTARALASATLRRASITRSA